MCWVRPHGRDTAPRTGVAMAAAHGPRAVNKVCPAVLGCSRWLPDQLEKSDIILNSPQLSVGFRSHGASERGHLRGGAGADWQQ